MPAIRPRTKSTLAASLFMASVAVAGWSPSASAVEYSAMAEGSLSFPDSEGLSFVVTPDLEIDPPNDTFPYLTTNHDASVVPDALLATASSSGTVGLSRQAEGGATAIATIAITNTTDDPLDLRFDFEYDTAAFVAGDATAGEAGIAGGGVTLVGGDISEGFSSFVDLDTDDLDVSDFGSLLLTATLGGGETLELELATAAFGSVAAVPLPPAALLLSGAMGGLLAFRRRRL